MGGCCIGDCDFSPLGDIFGCCVIDMSSFSCCVGYNSGPSDSEMHAKKIADELAEKKKAVRDKWENNEAALLNYINEKTTNLLTELQQINGNKFGDKTLDIDFDGINAKIEELKWRVVGHFGDLFDSRLVLTDKELSLILAEKDDEKRTKNFDSFYRKIEADAITSLKNKITEVVIAQSTIVTQAINARLAEVNRSIQKEADSYDALLKVKQISETETQLLQMAHIYTHGICEVIQQQLK